MNNNTNIHHYNYSSSSSSFSSSLLEEICRSFDDDPSHNRRRHSDISYKRMKAKSSSGTTYDRSKERDHKYENDTYRLNRYVLDQWVEKEKTNLRRNSMPTDVNFRRPVLSSSSTSSSDSASSGIGGFSSSDTDSMYGNSRPRIPSLKPIKTTSTNTDEMGKTKKGKKEGKLQQRALKLYGDLKKVKQPISPGGKLASFINSLFHAGASKKPKMEPLKSGKLSASTPSTASSYARSCLSKTPSSAGRSVKFCPVNVIVDEAGTRSVRNRDVSRMDVTSSLASDDAFKVQIMEKHRRVEEVAKELLKSYHDNNNSPYKKELKVNVVSDRNNKNSNIVNNKFVSDRINVRGFEEDEDDADADDESCCSSDLFELDNLLEIGMDDDRYSEELPVYETTHVATNRAIANGYIL